MKHHHNPHVQPTWNGYMAEVDVEVEDEKRNLLEVVVDDVE
jgi:hypothetical protein